MTDTRGDATAALVLNALAVLVALCAAGSSHVTQAAEPTGTLTLACQGTAIADAASFPDARPEPISMGIIVDFAARTVEGFSLIRAKIIEVTETSVSFRGSDDTHGSVIGGIDRVTGAVEAFTSLAKVTTSYSLKCKPTQRMF